MRQLRGKLTHEEPELVKFLPAHRTLSLTLRLLANLKDNPAIKAIE
jgi:hypothetical protein